MNRRPHPFRWFLLGALSAWFLVGVVDYFDSRRAAVMIQDLTDSYQECRDMLQDSGRTR